MYGKGPTVFCYLIVKQAFGHEVGLQLFVKQSYYASALK